MIEEVSISVPETQFYELQDELRKAQFVKVPYRENQLDMAHNTINQMQLHISRALERLDKIERRGSPTGQEAS